MERSNRKPFVPRSHIYTRTTRSCNVLHIPCCRLSYGQRSFTYRGCKLWNCISNDLKAADSVNRFKRRLAQKLVSVSRYCCLAMSSVCCLTKMRH